MFWLNEKQQQQKKTASMESFSGEGDFTGKRPGHGKTSGKLEGRTPVESL